MKYFTPIAILITFLIIMSEANALDIKTNGCVRIDVQGGFTKLVCP